MIEMASELERYRNWEHVGKTDDDLFREWLSSIPIGKKETNHTLQDFYDPEDKQKNHYTQNWPAYDAAKTQEEVLFYQLLAELLFYAIDKAPPTGGRQGFDNATKIFCMITKGYNPASFRRIKGKLQQLSKIGYIPKVPSFKSIDNFFHDEKLIPILDNLITMTSLPLAMFEETAALDSSGFSVSKYVQWINYKYGKEPCKQRSWVKAHVLSGTKTNIIFQMKVSPSSVADAPTFTPILRDARRFLSVKDIVADKGYLSRQNFQIAQELGLVAYIPFKSNSTGKSKGHRAWGHMFKAFKEHFDDYMKRYHRRSNAETVFHMLKTRFGASLSTKSLQANAIELKIRAICHNICVLIQEMYESVAEVDFLKITNTYKWS